MDTDFYALLGVSRTATDDELKKAYRKLARELHPDANPGNAESEERFKKVTLAYEVLRDPERRRQFDLYGIDGVRGSGGSGGQGGNPFGAGFEGGLGDLFDMFFGGGTPFGGSGGGGGAGGRRNPRGGPPPGPDVETVVSVPFEKSVFGGPTDIELQLPLLCSLCNGTGAAPGSEVSTCGVCKGQGEIRQVRQSILGQVVMARPCDHCLGTGRQIATPCPDCRGEGRRTRKTTYTVDLPPGIDRGQALHVPGRGGAGLRGGPPGDLYLRIDVSPHPRFRRQGFDLVHTLHVTMTQAALGVRLELETLDGSEEIHIDPGTQTGKLYRFRGKGVAQGDLRRRGDLIVEVVVDAPTKLTPVQDELLRQLAAERGESVAPPDHSLFGKFKGAFK